VKELRERVYSSKSGRNGKEVCSVRNESEGVTGKGCSKIGEETERKYC
jgi:hypothetical protein